MFSQKKHFEIDFLDIKQFLFVKEFYNSKILKVSINFVDISNVIEE